MSSPFKPPPDKDNPYASPETSSGPRSSNISAGKIIAIVVLTLTGISTLPFVFLYSCLGGGMLASALSGNRGGGEAIFVVAIGAGVLGVIAAIVFFVWLIGLVARTGSTASNYRPPERPFAVTPPPMGSGAPPANPARGHNPFGESAPPAPPLPPAPPTAS